MLKFFENVAIDVEGDTVYLANDNSSGCKYKFKSWDELKQIVADYITDLIDYDCEGYEEYQEERNDNEMTIKEIEDYYKKMAGNYAREAYDLRLRGEKSEENKEYDKAISLYTLSAENYDKSRLCTDFVNSLVKYEILKSTK